MSIINEALKKARREGQPISNNREDEGDTIIRPKSRAGKKPGATHVLPAILIVILFLAVAGGLGFFVYTEYFEEQTEPPQVEASSEPQPAIETETPDEVLAEPAPEEPPPADSLVRTPPETLKASTPPEDTSTAEPSAVRRAPGQLLSQFTINGVMRSSTSTRIITNTGVYQKGDTISSPSGYVLEEIGENNVILRSPDGNRYTVPLP